MQASIMTTRDLRREYALRLQTEEEHTKASDVKNRLRLRRQLRRAIEEVVRVDGDSPQLIQELALLVRSSNGRLDKRACC